MEMDHSLLSGSEAKVKRHMTFDELTPAQAGLSAALRRAFALPCEDADRAFDELLRKLG